MAIKAYVARAMSGRVKADVVKEAQADKEFLEKCGFEVLCPVTSEGILPTKDVLLSPKFLMDVYWKRDKAMIREAHVVFVMSPHVPSLGVIREYGYARYHLWKKVITVFPEGKIPSDGAICHYEDDYVTDSLIDAVGEALRTHETRWKRLKWRAKLYWRCCLKALWYKTLEWAR